jgi:hypothetical protein
MEGSIRRHGGIQAQQPSDQIVDPRFSLIIGLLTGCGDRLIYQLSHYFIIRSRARLLADETMLKMDGGGKGWGESSIH